MTEIQKNLEMNKIRAMINIKKIWYMTIYGQRPSYVKLPLWVLELLKESTLIVHPISCGSKEPTSTYMGLVLCGTLSITEIEEIEVF